MTEKKRNVSTKTGSFPTTTSALPRKDGPLPKDFNGQPIDFNRTYNKSKNGEHPRAAAEAIMNAIGVGYLDTRKSFRDCSAHFDSFYRTVEILWDKCGDNLDLLDKADEEDVKNGKPRLRRVQVDFMDERVARITQRMEHEKVRWGICLMMSRILIDTNIRKLVLKAGYHILLAKSNAISRFTSYRHHAVMNVMFFMCHGQPQERQAVAKVLSDQYLAFGRAILHWKAGYASSFNANLNSNKKGADSKKMNTCRKDAFDDTIVPEEPGKDNDDYYFGLWDPRGSPKYPEAIRGKWGKDEQGRPWKPISDTEDESHLVQQLAAFVYHAIQDLAPNEVFPELKVGTIPAASFLPLLIHLGLAQPHPHTYLHTLDALAFLLPAFPTLFDTSAELSKSNPLIGGDLVKPLVAQLRSRDLHIRMRTLSILDVVSFERQAEVMTKDRLGVGGFAISQKEFGHGILELSKGEGEGIEEILEWIWDRTKREVKKKKKMREEAEWLGIEYESDPDDPAKHGFELGYWRRDITPKSQTRGLAEEQSDDYKKLKTKNRGGKTKDESETRSKKSRGKSKAKDKTKGKKAQKYRSPESDSDLGNSDPGSGPDDDLPSDWDSADEKKYQRYLADENSGGSRSSDHDFSEDEEKPLHDRGLDRGVPMMMDMVQNLPMVVIPKLAWGIRDKIFAEFFETRDFCKLGEAFSDLVLRFESVPDGPIESRPSDIEIFSGGQGKSARSSRKTATPSSAPYQFYWEPLEECVKALRKRDGPGSEPAVVIELKLLIRSQKKEKKEKVAKNFIEKHNPKCIYAHYAFCIDNTDYKERLAMAKAGMKLNPKGYLLQGFRRNAALSAWFLATENLGSPQIDCHLSLEEGQWEYWAALLQAAYDDSSAYIENTWPDDKILPRIIWLNLILYIVVEGPDKLEGDPQQRPKLATMLTRARASSRACDLLYRVDPKICQEILGEWIVEHYLPSKAEWDPLLQIRFANDESPWACGPSLPPYEMGEGARLSSVVWHDDAKGVTAFDGTQSKPGILPAPMPASNRGRIDLRLCSHCRVPSAVVNKCGGCGLKSYCGKGCQRAAWKEGHKQECAGKGVQTREKNKNKETT